MRSGIDACLRDKGQLDPAAEISASGVTEAAPATTSPESEQAETEAEAEAKAAWTGAGAGAAAGSLVGLRLCCICDRTRWFAARAAIKDSSPASTAEPTICASLRALSPGCLGEGAAPRTPLKKHDKFGKYYIKQHK